VNWYLKEPTEKKKNSGDGKFIDYLLAGTEYHKKKITKKYAEKIKGTDPELYKNLQKIIIDWLRDNNRYSRCVKRIEYDKILPNETSFYSEKLINDTDRKNWLSKSLEHLSECKLVFLDPDNGIDFEDENRSTKHVYLNEIEAYFRKNKSLVIYQHADRDTKGFNKVIEKKTNQLMKLLELKNDEIICLRYKRGSARAFFIVMQQEHSDCITNAINHFLKTKWGKHFTEI